MKDVLENINNLNTPALEKREINIKVVFAPNEKRDQVKLKMTVKPKLSGYSGIESMAYVGETIKGMQAVENVPHTQNSILEELYSMEEKEKVRSQKKDNTTKKEELKNH